MTITGFIKSVGQERTFPGTDSNGLPKERKAIDVEIQSGSCNFAAAAFDDVCNVLVGAQPGALIVCELNFNTRSFTYQGGTGVEQRVTIMNARIMNPIPTF